MASFSFIFTKALSESFDDFCLSLFPLIYIYLSTFSFSSLIFYSLSSKLFICLSFRSILCLFSN